MSENRMGRIYRIDRMGVEIEGRVCSRCWVGLVRG